MCFFQTQFVGIFMQNFVFLDIVNRFSYYDRMFLFSLIVHHLNCMQKSITV
jgi:hypothetical protein